MNSFCLECTGYKKKLIRSCEDKCCPFYRIRKADWNHEDDEIITKKLKGTVCQ